MATRNTRSAVTDAQGNNRTATHLSTNIIIKARGYVVGAIQSLSVKESRDVEMISELGTDGHIDSAPKSSTNISGDCKRIRFSGMRIAEAFGSSFTHVHSQRIPFDIEIQDIFADANIANAIVTTIHNVWITDINYDMSADNWIISDSMSWKAESISSILAGGNVVTSVANGQDGPLYINKYEQEADRGVYRGALDAAGVLTAFLTDPTG